MSQSPTKSQAQVPKSGLDTFIDFMSSFHLLTYLVVLELRGLDPGAAKAALHHPHGALLGHVLLVLGPGDRLVAGLAQGDVPGAVDHVQLIAGPRNTAPAKNYREISFQRELIEVF